ncbi:MAG: IclR family transcriptional regulator [Spirochaetaceae bacterium]|nr:IclR family transcriptional regulator [Spirochaetaceae bacterium]
MGKKEGLAPVKAVGKTILIIEALAERDSVGVTEIAELTGLAKATAFRFLNTLKDLGYVQQNGDSSQYSLTLKLFEVAGLVRSRRTILDDAKPILRSLADTTKETVHLATVEGGHLVYLDKIESRLALKVSMMSAIGHSAPMYCTGVGKALLAFLPEEEANEILRNTELRRFTPNSITDLELLKNELHRIRDVGYAQDNEEHEVGVRCIAAPILNRDKQVVAALSVSVPSVRLTNENFGQLRSKVLEAAKEIGTIVGSETRRSIARGNGLR